jgi:hypothetical protein
MSIPVAISSAPAPLHTRVCVFPVSFLFLSFFILLFALVVYQLFCIVRYLSASGGGFVGGPFLLHGLVFRESKSHPLRHFDVSTGAIFLGGGWVDGGMLTE